MNDNSVRKIFFDPNVMVVTFINALVLGAVSNIVLFYFPYWVYWLTAFIGTVLILAVIDFWWLRFRYYSSLSSDGIA